MKPLNSSVDQYIDELVIEWAGKKWYKLRGQAPAGGSNTLAVCSRRLYFVPNLFLSLLLSLLLAQHDTKILPYHVLLTMMLCCTPGPETTQGNLD